MKIYDCKNHKTIKNLVHIDAYRINSEKDIEAIGATEYFNRDDVVVAIEWADKIKKALPINIKQINIIYNNNKRLINI